MSTNSLENGPFNQQLSAVQSKCCGRCLHSATLRNSNISKCLLPLIVALIFVFIFYISKNYIKLILMWIEQQNSSLIFLSFICCFTIVSFPVTVGYLILIITSGYLFGVIKGLATVVLGANIGSAIAHGTIKSLQNRLPIQRLLKNDIGRAILRVIAGPRAFKVVLLARLTPIPFGLQNTIFGVSNVHPKSYYIATLLGLFPAQAINVYIGSSLRSMHDVFNNHSTALASYAMFAVQICIGFILMIWVVHKARRELSEALLLDMENDYNVCVEIQA